MEPLKLIRVYLTPLQYQRLKIMAEKHHLSITQEISAIIRENYWESMYDYNDNTYPEVNYNSYAVDDHYPDE